MSLYDLSLMIGSFLILITLFARLNDMKPEETDIHHWIRRLSFLAVITACAMLIAAPVAANVPYWRELTITLLIWGMFGVLFTSPNQKPWWELIVGPHTHSAFGSRKDRIAAAALAVKKGFVKERRVSERRE